MDDLTADDLEVLFVGWALAAKGEGFAPSADSLPAYARMEERGWLERRWCGADAVFFWTPRAELALDIDRLTEQAKANRN